MSHVCQKHWDDLRRGVDDRGMSHLVHKDGKSLAESVERELRGQKKDEDWDPLMAAWANFGKLAFEKAGLAALNPDFCILCEIQESYENLMANPEQMNDPSWPKGAIPKDAQGWIDSCLDAMLKYAREKAYVPGVN